MRKRLLIAAGIVLGVLVVGCAGLVGGGALLNPRIEVQTEATLDASPEALWPHLTTHQGLQRWWGHAAGDAGSAMAVEHAGGPDHGVGLAVDFVAGGATMEHWVLTKETPHERVEYDVDFGILEVHRTLTVHPEGTGSRVVWHEAGRIDNPALRWLTLWPEDSVVANFQGALGALDEVASKGP